ncbi:MAG: hypothetical protein GXO84_02875 [Chlorobi bacterium]|nr:hypothetical protein [Chlorobiota bacterium]
MKRIKILCTFFLSFIILGCSKNNSNEDNFTVIIEPVTFQLLDFEFTPQTETQEERVAYQIEFFNVNDFQVSGSPRVTLKIDGLESTSTPNADCQIILSNSSCILSYEVLGDSPLIFPISVEFVKAEYLLN